MSPKPRAYVAALPLSALPDLQDLLAPFFAAKGQPRDHVVMARLGDEAVQRLDDLVEADIFGSRSEAAAFLIGAGIHAQNALFTRIADQTSEIKKLRDELRQSAREALSAAASPAPERPEKPSKARKPRGGGVRT
jgi:Arc/MetJ-type ribon-helix-helix transcriptional regulator